MRPRRPSGVAPRTRANHAIGAIALRSRPDRHANSQSAGAEIEICSRAGALAVRVQSATVNRRPARSETAGRKPPRLRTPNRSILDLAERMERFGGPKNSHDHGHTTSRTTHTMQEKLTEAISKAAAHHTDSSTFQLVQALLDDPTQPASTLLQALTINEMRRVAITLNEITKNLEYIANR